MPPPTGDWRLAALRDWLRLDLGHSVDDIRPASSDASFRRYFRVLLDGESYIAMDAPPPMEDVRPFVRIARLLRQADVQAPNVHAANEQLGFLLLDDFGTVSYLDRLDDETAGALYGDALDSLIDLQSGIDVNGSFLPPYDETLLLREMDLFRDWFIGRLLGLELSPAESALLDNTWQILAASALEQPQVCVHRDYHSRNLMVTQKDNPGILDFQDAVIGPITYDLVSLLRDCYIAWPEEQVVSWALEHHARTVEAGLLQGVDASLFLRWFDWMGIQRHLKAIGIFARLKLRDDKPGYLRDIPRTLNYVTRIACGYPELSDFLDFLNNRVVESIALHFSER